MNTSVLKDLPWHYHIGIGVVCLLCICITCILTWLYHHKRRCADSETSRESDDAEILDIGKGYESYDNNQDTVCSCGNDVVMKMECQGCRRTVLGCIECHQRFSECGCHSQAQYDSEKEHTRSERKDKSEATRNWEDSQEWSGTESMEKQPQVYQNVHVTISEMIIEAVHLQQISPDGKTMRLFEKELLRAPFGKKVKFEGVVELKEINQSKTEIDSSNQSKTEMNESPNSKDSNQSTTEMDVGNQPKTKMHDTTEHPAFDRESVRYSDGKVITAKDTNLFQNAAARETLNVRIFPTGPREIPAFPTATELVPNPALSVLEDTEYLNFGKRIDSSLSYEASPQSQHSEHSQYSQSQKVTRTSTNEMSQPSTSRNAKDEQIENVESDLRESMEIVATLKANLTETDNSSNCDDNEVGNRSYSLQEADEVMTNIVSDLAYRRVKSMIPQEDIVAPLPLIDMQMQDENASNSTNRSTNGWELVAKPFAGSESGEISNEQTPRSRNGMLIKQEFQKMLESDSEARSQSVSAFKQDDNQQKQSHSKSSARSAGERSRTALNLYSDGEEVFSEEQIQIARKSKRQQAEPKLFVTRHQRSSAIMEVDSGSGLLQADDQKEASSGRTINFGKRTGSKRDVHSDGSFSVASHASETVTNTFDLKRISGYHPQDRRSFLNKLLRASNTNDAGKQIAKALQEQERHRVSSDGSVSGSIHRNVPPYSCVDKLQAFKHHLEKSVEQLEDLADSFVGFQNVDHPEGELLDDSSYGERTGKEDTPSNQLDKRPNDNVPRKMSISVRRRRSNSELQFLKDCQMEQRISDEKMQSSAWTKEIRRKSLRRQSMQM